ncbi:acyl carrier protein [Streptomyces sp. NPDC059679]|uniref:acyl carrier protein n=1 Tax=unclassified Streptomyces TaxID=2593676 RepID=UPI003674DC27
MNHDEARKLVLNFLAPQLGGHTPAEDDDIFALGYVNSLFAVQLAVFVEKATGTELGPDDMDFENFRTTGGLVRLITSKTATAA